MNVLADGLVFENTRQKESCAILSSLFWFSEIRCECVPVDC